MEHPEISRALATGYPVPVYEKEGSIDFFGTEIQSGDEVVTDPNNGEIVLKEDLERYLKEVYDFEFSTAE